MLTRLAVLMLVAATGACSFVSVSPLHRECRPWVAKFFRDPEDKKVATSAEERISDFGDYQVEDQYEIYICGNQFVHPPTIYLAEPFARSGPTVVSFLKSRLTEATRDVTIRDIIMVFEEMDRQNTYDVSGDDELMRLMTNRIATMKNEGWRRMTQEMFDRIED